MTPVQFAEYVRLKTRTDSTTFTNDDIVIFMRQRQDDIAQEVLKAKEDILLIPQVDDLVASSITAREYSVPVDILSRLKRIEAKLDGTTWTPLTEIDLTDIRVSIATETEITNTFNNSRVSKQNPGGARYDIIRKSIFIYSGTITATTDGLKMWCNTWPTAITNLALTGDMSVDQSTTTHGIPRALHHLWAKGVIIDYKTSKEKPIPLTEREPFYEGDLRKAIETLRHGNLDREVTGDLPPASDRGNDGSE